MQTIKEELEKIVENYLNTDKFRVKSSKDDLELSFGQLIEKTIKEALENGFKAGVEFAQQWISVEDELPEDNKLVIFKDNVDTIFLRHIDNRYWYEKREYCDQDVDYVTHWRPININ